MSRLPKGATVVVIDEGALREEFPEIPWDQPVEVHVVNDRAAGNDFYGWCCRYCIAMHGLKAQDIIYGRVPEQVFDSRDRVLDHIEAAHHD
jgi:hypothetical protein